MYNIFWFASFSLNFTGAFIGIDDKLLDDEADFSEDFAPNGVGAFDDIGGKLLDDGADFSEDFAPNGVGGFDDIGGKPLDDEADFSEDFAPNGVGAVVEIGGKPLDNVDFESVLFAEVIEVEDSSLLVVDPNDSDPKLKPDEVSEEGCFT